MSTAEKPGQVLETKTQDRERLTGWLSGYNGCSTNKMSRFPPRLQSLSRLLKCPWERQWKRCQPESLWITRAANQTETKIPVSQQYGSDDVAVTRSWTQFHHCSGSYRQFTQMEPSCKSRTDMSHFKLMFNMSANQQSRFKQPHRSFRAISEVSSEGNRVL